MTVTELAVLRLKDHVSVHDAQVQDALRRAQEGQSGYKGRPMWWLQQLEDPRLLYVIGGWGSTEEHYGEWIPSQTNRELFWAISQYMDFQWIEHIDVAPASLPISAPVLAIERHFVTSRSRTAFSESFGSDKPHLPRLVKGQEALGSSPPMVGGWRIEKGGPGTDRDGEEEFVVFFGWNSVEQYNAFANSDCPKKYIRTEELSGSADVKHARVLG